MTTWYLLVHALSVVSGIGSNKSSKHFLWSGWQGTVKTDLTLPHSWANSLHSATNKMYEGEEEVQTFTKFTLSLWGITLYWPSAPHLYHIIHEFTNTFHLSLNFMTFCFQINFVWCMMRVWRWCFTIKSCTAHIVQCYCGFLSLCSVTFSWRWCWWCSDQASSSWRVYKNCRRGHISLL